jgi:hypothetical protein
MTAQVNSMYKFVIRLIVSYLTKPQLKPQSRTSHLLFSLTDVHCSATAAEQMAGHISSSQPIGKPTILFQTNGKRLENVQ